MSSQLTEMISPSEDLLDGEFAQAANVTDAATIAEQSTQRGMAGQTAKTQNKGRMDRAPGLARCFRMGPE